MFTAGNFPGHIPQCPYDAQKDKGTYQEVIQISYLLVFPPDPPSWRENLQVGVDTTLRP